MFEAAKLTLVARMAWMTLAGACLVAGCGLSGDGVSRNDDDDDGSSDVAAPTTGSGESNSSSNNAGSGGSGAAAGSGGHTNGSGAGPSGSGGAGVGGSGTGAGDPNCYTEALDPDADISDLVSAYGGSNWKDELIEAMGRRWPAGAYLLEEQKNDSYFNQFSDSSSWPGMVSWLDTLVHEETHLFNAYHAIAVGEPHALYFREDLILYLPQDQGFYRAEILDDLTPQAAAGIYADTYLTGSQGQRGFNALLDEANCYANEIPGMSSFGEYYNGGVSLRDGAAAFLYFLQVYLRVARTEYPAYYSSIQADPVYRDAVELLWLRTHFFFQHADTFPNLGINDDMYRAEAYKPENLAEIDMFIGATVGPSNCLQ